MMEHSILGVLSLSQKRLEGFNNMSIMDSKYKVINCQLELDDVFLLNNIEKLDNLNLKLTD